MIGKGSALLNLGILVSGRGSNMDAIVANCANGSLSAQVAVVISDNPDALALTKAREAGIPAFCLKNPRDEGEVIALLDKHGVELVCLAGYMRLIKQDLLQAYPMRIINIHPSLLPAFPGLNVQARAIEAGVKFSGATVHFVDAGMDTGPIICQAVVPVLDEDTCDSLSARILEQEHVIYSQAIEKIAQKRLRVVGRRVISL